MVVIGVLLDERAFISLEKDNIGPVDIPVLIEIREQPLQVVRFATIHIEMKGTVLVKVVKSDMRCYDPNNTCEAKFAMYGYRLEKRLHADCINQPGQERLKLLAPDFRGKTAHRRYNNCMVVNNHRSPPRPPIPTTRIFCCTRPSSKSPILFSFQ